MALYTEIGPVGRRSNMTILPKVGLTGQFCFSVVGLTGQLVNVGEFEVLLIENKSVKQDYFEFCRGQDNFIFKIVLLDRFGYRQLLTLQN